MTNKSPADHELTLQWREALREALDLRTLQARLIAIKKDADAFARVAPDGSPSREEKAQAIARCRARISACQEDVRDNIAFARLLGADPLLTDELTKQARQLTEQRHCGWLFEPLGAEVRNAGNAALCKRLQKMLEACQPQRARIAAAAAELAARDVELRDALERLGLEVALSSAAAERDSSVLDQLLAEDFATLAAAHAGHLRLLEVLVAGVALGKPKLRAALRHAGGQVLVTAHAGWLGARTKLPLSMFMTGAVLDAFAGLDQIKQDSDALYRICADVIREESNAAIKSRGWSREECLSVAGEVLCQLRDRSTWQYLETFLGYYRLTLRRALARRWEPEGEPFDDDDLNALNSIRQSDPETHSALLSVLDAVVCEFWPEHGRAIERRKLALAMLRWLRGWLDGEDNDLVEWLTDVLPMGDSEDPARRIAKVRERMRKDITMDISDACKRVGCAEVAPPLAAFVVYLLAPVIDRKPTGSFPYVLPALQAAKAKLETADHPPVWLCRLVNWVVDFLEGSQ